MNEPVTALNSLNELPKTERTRAALITATETLLVARNHRDISIQDITREANVGLGTFYNYFDHKQMAFEAVLQEASNRFQARLDNLRACLTDPASIVAATLQYCMQEALDNQEWQNLRHKCGFPDDYLLMESPEQLLEDLTLGARKGRFKIDQPELVANLIVAMAKHTTLDILAGRQDRSAIQSTIRYILRMLGLSEMVARAVTQAPLPPVAAPARRQPREVLPHLAQRGS